MELPDKLLQPPMLSQVRLGIVGTCGSGQGSHMHTCVAPTETPVLCMLQSNAPDGAARQDAPSGLSIASRLCKSARPSRHPAGRYPNSSFPDKLKTCSFKFSFKKLMGSSRSKALFIREITES